MARANRRFAALILGGILASSLTGAPASAGPLDPVVDVAAAILEPISDPMKEFYEDFFRSTEDEVVQGLREVRDLDEVDPIQDLIDTLIDEIDNLLDEPDA
jgi:hypothetical protein